MPETYSFAYYDLRAGVKSDTPEPLFPGWQEGDERVCILAAHDVDALLGAGYLILACVQNRVEVSVIVCCDGRAGYSAPEQKDAIVEVRRKEAVAAYGSLGVPPDQRVRLHFLGFPDLSLAGHRGWVLPGGQQGALPALLRTLRELNATRLLIPNGYREHPDNAVVWQMGSEEASLASEPVLPDFGQSRALRSLLQYAVRGDFSPEDALLTGADPRQLRANRAIVAGREVEEKVEEAINCFSSQERIIQKLVALRRGRFFEGRALEPYLWFDPRPQLHYQPYHARIREIS